MLEIACILSLAVGDYEDFGIIAAMLICNGYLGFHEELKAKASLVHYFILEMYISESVKKLKCLSCRTS